MTLQFPDLIGNTTEATLRPPIRRAQRLYNIVLDGAGRDSEGRGRLLDYCDATATSAAAGYAAMSYAEAAYR